MSFNVGGRVQLGLLLYYCSQALLDPQRNMLDESAVVKRVGQSSVMATDSAYN